jgi:vacuolar-type H+-ATPase subunit F/Vma7
MQNKNGEKMKISFIKYEKDTNEYTIPKLLGMNIEKIKEPEEIDKKIDELKEKKYTTIIISNELASFSEKLEKQYKYDTGINIIITPNKNK